MTWIVTRLCRDCIDTDCVAVCPGEDEAQFPNQLFINRPSR